MPGKPLPIITEHDLAAMVHMAVLVAQVRTPAAISQEFLALWREVHNTEQETA